MMDNAFDVDAKSTAILVFRPRCAEPGTMEKKLLWAVTHSRKLVGIRLAATFKFIRANCARRIRPPHSICWTPPLRMIRIGHKRQSSFALSSQKAPKTFLLSILNSTGIKL